MTDFIPPYPERPAEYLGPLETIKRARNDLLSIWPEIVFTREFISLKILNYSVFIANCPEIVRHIFVTNQTNYERKGFVMRSVLEPLAGDGLIISDGKTWHKHKRLEAPLFTPDYVTKYSHVMIQTTSECIQRWATITPGSTIAVLPEMAKLTAEIICRTLFGSELTTQQIEQVVEGFAKYQAVMLPKNFPSLLWKRKAKAAAKGIHEVVDHLIAEGVTKSNEGTLLSLLLKLRNDDDPENGLTSKQIRNELIVLFLAGHETTANTLAWSWYLISQCPEVEQRLHQEVDKVLANRTATFDDFSQLNYTQAIIEETLRLYPPIPILSREAKEKDFIRNKEVPAGSTMLIVPWLLHRHKKLWDKPDHFIPERFLPNAPKPDKYAYIPFSGGPRVCIGKFFATVETTLCLAMLARNFRLTIPEGQTVSHECRLTLRPSDNLPMQITPR